MAAEGREFITDPPSGQGFFENNPIYWSFARSIPKLAFLGSSFYQIAVFLSFPVKLLDAAATVALGREIGLVAKAGDVIALVGDLGAGKTTLTQGIVEGLGYEQEVTSPTFSLVQEYLGGRLEIFHFDFYRVEEEHELLDLGWDDYLDRQGVVIVEWPNLHSHLLPKHTWWLKLSHIEDGRLAEST